MACTTAKVDDSGVVRSPNGALARAVTVGSRRFDLTYRDIGRGDRHQRLEVVASSPGGQGVASISQTSPLRRALRRGLPGSVGGEPVTVRKADGLRWRRLVVEGAATAWTVERVRGGVEITDRGKRIMMVPKDSSSMLLDEAISVDETALCVGLWTADVAETLAWWYWVQFL